MIYPISKTEYGKQTQHTYSLNIFNLLLFDDLKYACMSSNKYVIRIINILYSILKY